MPAQERVRNLSVGEYFYRRYRKAPLSRTFRADNAGDFDTWKSEFRTALLDCLGPFPDPCDPDPETLEVVDEGEYWREKIVFNAEPDMAVAAYLLVPKDIPEGEERPAVLACHGHGAGKDDVCGIDHGEKPGYQRIKDLNYDYARQLALRGYVVLAPDWRGFGERGAGGNWPPNDPCAILLTKGLLLGLNVLTLNIWDAFRSIDYLVSRPEVDADRIGCVGLSYGGTMTMFTAALDERVRCAVVSGYLNSFGANAIGLGDACGISLPFGLLDHGEMRDVACMIAPRPLLIESGTKDPAFRIEVTREEAGVVRSAFEASGVPERFDIDEFEGEHQWSGRKAYDWLDRWLGAPRGI